ncbi:hypothetical protein PT7_1876 [Pusillimonas sp. T7-7]|uniref:DUF2950 family protein n=1 Tax=Pusillimonas sp. (strain T7-7) TaxID=1007105 RepID=UPI0002084775|nr:DUF2950 family protein [Pusillimonas sp. T7-7]AEC20416.1 hypothetical protein PT7_1876 [Pusillimonas sp. T7-7]
MTKRQQSSLALTLVRNFLLGSMATLSLSPAAHAQEAFRYPEMAMNAFVQAVDTNDQDALTRILGSNYRQFIPENLNQDVIDAFMAAWKERHSIALSSASAWLEVGDSYWRMPVPVVQTNGMWQFDLDAGAAEMQRRKLGRNELGAIAALQLLQGAQRSYRQTQGHYASRVISEPATHNGLYWPNTENTAPSPLDFNALAMTSDTPADAAYSGYHFKILPGASSRAYSIVAWPAEYGVSGVHSFLAKQDGTISESLSELNADTVSTRNIPWKRLQ